MRTRNSDRQIQLRSRSARKSKNDDNDDDSRSVQSLPSTTIAKQNQRSSRPIRRPQQQRQQQQHQKAGTNGKVTRASSQSTSPPPRTTNRQRKQQQRQKSSRNVGPGTVEDDHRDDQSVQSLPATSSSVSSMNRVVMSTTNQKSRRRAASPPAAVNRGRSNPTKKIRNKVPPPRRHDSFPAVDDTRRPQRLPQSKKKNSKPNNGGAAAAKTSPKKQQGTKTAKENPKSKSSSTTRDQTKQKSTGTDKRSTVMTEPQSTSTTAAVYRGKTSSSPPSKPNRESTKKKKKNPTKSSSFFGNLLKATYPSKPQSSSREAGTKSDKLVTTNKKDGDGANNTLSDAKDSQENDESPQQPSAQKGGPLPPIFLSSDSFSSESERSTSTCSSANSSYIGSTTSSRGSTQVTVPAENITQMTSYDSVVSEERTDKVINSFGGITNSMVKEGNTSNRSSIEAPSATNGHHPTSFVGGIMNAFDSVPSSLASWMGMDVVCSRDTTISGRDKSFFSDNDTSVITGLDDYDDDDDDDTREAPDDSVVTGLTTLPDDHANGSRCDVDLGKIKQVSSQVSEHIEHHATNICLAVDSMTDIAHEQATTALDCEERKKVPSLLDSMRKDAMKQLQALESRKVPDPLEDPESLVTRSSIVADDLGSQQMGTMVNHDTMKMTAATDIYGLAHHHQNSRSQSHQSRRQQIQQEHGLQPRAVHADEMPEYHYNQSQEQQQTSSYRPIQQVPSPSTASAKTSIRQQPVSARNSSRNVRRGATTTGGGFLGVLEREMATTSKNMPTDSDDMVLFLGDELEKSASTAFEFVSMNHRNVLGDNKNSNCSDNNPCTPEDLDAVEDVLNSLEFGYEESLAVCGAPAMINGHLPRQQPHLQTDTRMKVPPHNQLHSPTLPDAPQGHLAGT